MTIIIKESCKDWHGSIEYDFPERELSEAEAETVNGILHIICDALAVLLNPGFGDVVHNILMEEYRGIVSHAREAFMDALDDAQFYQICATEPSDKFSHQSLYGFDLREELSGMLEPGYEQSMLETINKFPQSSGWDYDDDEEEQP